MHLEVECWQSERHQEEGCSTCIICFLSARMRSCCSRCSASLAALLLRLRAVFPLRLSTLAHSGPQPRCPRLQSDDCRASMQGLLKLSRAQPPSHCPYHATMHSHQQATHALL